MIWNKSKEKSSEGHKENPQLTLWEVLVKDVLDVYASTRAQLVQLERWDFQQKLAAACQVLPVQDMQKTLGKLRESFQEARTKEMAFIHKQVGDLRSMVWISIDQICSVMETSGRSAEPIAKARDSLQKALRQSDLEIARKTIKEVLVALSEMDRDRQSALNTLQASFKTHLKVLQSELQSMQKELQLDSLTQVYNRGTFDQHLRKSVQLAYLGGHTSCLVMLDIDHFKKVNDSYGHPAGDAVIQACAKAIVQAFPSRDDFVARYGGEEFAVVIQDCSLEGVRASVDKMMAKIRSLKINTAQGTIMFTLSAGVAAYESGESPADWLARADRALYKAKQQGRNQQVLAETPRGKAS